MVQRALSNIFISLYFILHVRAALAMSNPEEVVRYSVKRAEMTCLGPVELGLVPDRIDDRKESFKRQSDDAVRRRDEHAPQRHLNTQMTTDTRVLVIPCFFSR